MSSLVSIELCKDLLEISQYSGEDTWSTLPVSSSFCSTTAFERQLSNQLTLTLKDSACGQEVLQNKILGSYFTKSVFITYFSVSRLAALYKIRAKIWKSVH